MYICYCYCCFGILDTVTSCLEQFILLGDHVRWTIFEIDKAREHKEHKKEHKMVSTNMFEKMYTLKEINPSHPACSHAIRDISTFWFHIPFGLRPHGIWNQNVDISRIA